MDSRDERLLAQGRRKIGPDDGVPVILAVFDEVAYFSATVGEPKQQKEFTALLRDLVARGRAAGVIVVAATQRPSADIIPTSLRDLFGYRWAFRCSTEASSDVILGHGWAQRGTARRTSTRRRVESAGSSPRAASLGGSSRRSCPMWTLPTSPPMRRGSAASRGRTPPDGRAGRHSHPRGSGSWGGGVCRDDGPRRPGRRTATRRPGPRRARWGRPGVAAAGRRAGVSMDRL